jgi:hypothetical protein
MKKTVLTSAAARGGSIEHVTRYMLAGSLVLIVVAMIVVLTFVG